MVNIGGNTYYYGNSYTAGSGANPSNRRFSTVSALAMGTTEVNRGESGATAKEILEFCLGNYPDTTRTWVPNSPASLIVIMPALNSIRRHGTRYPEAFRHQIRGLVSTVRCGSKIENAAWSTTGSWLTETYAMASGGELMSSADLGALATVSFNGTECTFMGWVVGGQNVLVQYWLDGVMVRQLNYAGVAYTDGLDGNNDGATGSNNTQIAERFTNLTPGAHVLEVRRTGGTSVSRIYVDCLLVGSLNPSKVLVVQDNPLNTWDNTPPRDNGSDTALSMCNGIMANVVAEYDANVKLAPAAPNWNKLVNLSSDNVHPNNGGHAIIAQQVVSGANEFDWYATGTGKPTFGTFGAAPLATAL